MALSNFIPVNIVIALLLDELRRASVFKQLIKTDTASNLKKGGSYDIPGIGDVTVGDYTVDNDITIQAMDDAGTTLTIDQQKYFAVYYDKVDDAKSARNVAPLILDKGLYKLSQAEDVHIAAKMASEAGIKELASIGTIALPLVVDIDGIFDFLGECKILMDENDVPVNGRRMALPPFMTGLITKSNVQIDTTGDPEARTTGWVNRHSGFDLYQSNNLVETGARTGVNVVAWIESSFFAVDSLSQVELWDKVEKRFAELIKGLHVYGTKTITPNAVLRGVVSAA